MGRRGPYWMVLKTKQASSRDAITNITRQGFNYFHPMFRAQSVRGVRRPEPLFPHYLSVQVDERKHDWKSLCSTKGVAHVLGKVRDEVINHFRTLTDDTEDGYYQDPSSAAPRFKSESVVLGRRGLFENQFGVYRGLAGNRAERVRVLFNILGREAEFEVSAFDLVAAA